MKKIGRFLASLKLTAALLAFAIALVFIGTLAQVDDGLYGAQTHYFKQWLVIGMTLLGRKIPVILPGGYLIGTLLLVNLVYAHVYRFELTTKKIGIQIAHAGIILLLVGQLATDLFAREMLLKFDEGQTRNYMESANDSELLFQNGDAVTTIPVTLLKPGGELKIRSLPFAIRVKSFWNNSVPAFRAPMLQNGPPLTSNGLALSFDFRRVADAKTTDGRNVPTAVIELTGSGDASSPSSSATGNSQPPALGDWVVSDWAGDADLAEVICNNYTSSLGIIMARKIAAQLVAPQSVEFRGQNFTFLMRPTRFLQPFSLTLLKASHTVYPGTDIPKDFRSRALLQNSQTGEKREVEISMNHPLRYRGLTFYQYQMDAGQTANQAGHTPSSVLQVVRNPGWLTPYVGCAMVGVGLVIQFLQHLVGFVTRKK